MDQSKIFERIKAPELEVESWLNTNSPILLSDFIGKPVVLHSFQMLCPGCIFHGLPQAQRLSNFFSNKGVQVIALHTVFENHLAMQQNSLETFIYEFRYTFPVGIDKPSKTENPIPITMEKFGLRGTPSLVLVDKKGFIANHYFGSVSDLELGSEITRLLYD